MNETIDTIQKKHQVETLTRIEEYKRRQLELSHRVLQVTFILLVNVNANEIVCSKGDEKGSGTSK
jgi:hypothetical protein